MKVNEIKLKEIKELLERQREELYNQIKELDYQLDFIDDIEEIIECAEEKNYTFEEYYKSRKQRLLSSIDGNDNESYIYWTQYYKNYEDMLKKVSE